MSEAVTYGNGVPSEGGDGERLSEMEQQVPDEEEEGQQQGGRRNDAHFIQLVSTASVEDLISVNDPHLVEINLNEQKIDFVTMKQLCQVLPRYSKLKKLCMSRTNTGSRGVRSLCRVLETNATLLHLNLGCNRFDDMGARCIGELLKVNRTLKKLFVSTNYIGPEGIVSIAGALAQNTVVESVGLSGNCIGIVGAEAIRDMLVTNKTLKKLSLGSQPDYSREMQDIFIQGLKQNTTLENYLWYNADDSLKAEVQDYRHCKENGYALLREASTTDALWANALARMRKEPNLIYAFLKEKPDLVGSDTKQDPYIL